jgi:hypothetical protein
MIFQIIPDDVKDCEVIQLQILYKIHPCKFRLYYQFSLSHLGTDLTVIIGFG